MLIPNLVIFLPASPNSNPVGQQAAMNNQQFVDAVGEGPSSYQQNDTSEFDVGRGNGMTAATSAQMVQNI